MPRPEAAQDNFFLQDTEVKTRQYQEVIENIVLQIQASEALQAAIDHSEKGNGTWVITMPEPVSGRLRSGSQIMISAQGQVWMKTFHEDGNETLDRNPDFNRVIECFEQKKVTPDMITRNFAAEKEVLLSNHVAYKLMIEKSRVKKI